MTYTKQEVAAAVRVMKAIADAIKEAGRIPSGHLYAVLSADGCSLSNYETIISNLKQAGFVEETPMHELIWIDKTPSL